MSSPPKLCKLGASLKPIPGIYTPFLIWKQRYLSIFMVICLALISIFPWILFPPLPTSASPFPLRPRFDYVTAFSYTFCKALATQGMPTFGIASHVDATVNRTVHCGTEGLFLSNWSFHFEVRNKMLGTGPALESKKVTTIPAISRMPFRFVGDLLLIDIMPANWWAFLSGSPAPNFFHHLASPCWSDIYRTDLFQWGFLPWSWLLHALL